MIADTQFIFGLRSNDIHFDTCQEILRNHSSKLIIPTIALLESSMVLISKNKSDKNIENFLKTVQDLISLYSLSEYKLKSTELIKAYELQQEYPSLGFFDSLIVATALNLNLPVLGNDKVFTRISKLEYKKLKDMIN